MFDILKMTLLSSAILVGAALTPALGEPVAPASADGWAIVDVPRPNERNLMHLVGIVGRGHAVVRVPGEDRCRSFAVRLVAGGFWGRRVANRGEDVRLMLTGPALLRRFSRGYEVISGEHVVTTDASDVAGEIVIVSGLPADAGFVIRPGGSPLAEFLGPRIRRVSCERALREVTP